MGIFLKGKLNKANFRKTSEPEKSCRWCVHHAVKITDNSDPDDSPRKFYCKYLSFKFDSATSITHLRSYTCDYYKPDSRIEDLFGPQQMH